MTSNDGRGTMDEAARLSASRALGLVPSGLYVLTAQHEDQRCGILVSWVQQVCFTPPMISVSVAKGRLIMPLISESRWFGLCQLGETDRRMVRKFAQPVPVPAAINDPDAKREDPFLGYQLLSGTLAHVPILAGTLAHFECELTCHLDVEGDHDLFIGVVRAAAVRGSNDKPCVHLRDDGFGY